MEIFAVRPPLSSLVRSGAHDLPPLRLRCDRILIPPEPLLSQDSITSNRPNTSMLHIAYRRFSVNFCKTLEKIPESVL